MKRFADPERYDFRPIQDVQIGMPAEIKAGMTILLEEESCPRLVIAVDNVTVRTRGRGKRAVVRGAHITGNNVTLEDLDFREDVIFSGSGGSVRSCEFAAGAHFSGSGLALTHNRFKVMPDVSRAAGFEYANVGAAIRAPGLFSVGPGQSFDAMPDGPYRLLPRRSAGIIGKPAVYALSDTTCDIEWWTDATNVTSELKLMSTRQPFIFGRMPPMLQANSSGVPRRNAVKKPETPFPAAISTASPFPG